MRKFSARFTHTTLTARLLTLIALIALVTAATATAYMQVQQSTEQTKGEKGSKKSQVQIQVQPPVQEFDKDGKPREDVALPAAQEKEEVAPEQPVQNLEGFVPQKANEDTAGARLVSMGKTVIAPKVVSATTYPMTTPAAALEDTTGATTIVASGQDDTASLLFNIGFDFWFNGVRYTTFSAQSNGLMKLGSPVVTTAFTNALASATDNPKIAPYWDDQTTGSDGYVRAIIFGAAPNRKLVVEWKTNTRVDGTSITAVTDKVYQAWISETTGKIQFVYGAIPAGVSYTTGIAASATSFASVTTSTDTVSYTTADDNNAAAIASGKSYLFTPPVPAAPTNLTFTTITPTSVAFTYTDNATNELGYPIFLSSDGVNYFFIGQLAANTTSINVTGLNPGTTYFFKVNAVTEGALSNSLIGSATTAAATLSGTKTVCPTGCDYPTLTAARTDIQAKGLVGPLTLELQSTYVSTAETFPITFFRAPGTNTTNTITVVPAANATDLTITSANTTATISLNGATNVIFDGRPGATGTSKQLTIDNTATAGNATIRFDNDATNDTIKFCTVRGVATSTTGGVILFSTTTGANGNDNNTIDNCDIRDGAGGTPTNSIYSSGTTTTAAQNNSGNTISNNNIFNFYNSTSTANGGVGINISTGTTDWNITGNSFYQTATRTTFGAGSTVNAILLSNSTGNNFVVSGNFIGGTAPQAGGTAWTINSATTTIFRGIQATVGSTTPTSIQGNTIQNLSITTTSASSAQSAISLVTGSFNVGNVTGNTIGSQSATGNITFSTSGASAFFSGIIAGTGTPATINISNNTIGGISVSGAGTVSTRGISVQAQTGQTPVYTIAGNTIGSPTTANSISNATNSSLLGIFVASTPVVTIPITGNTVANLSNTSTGTTATVVGIATQTTGVHTITGNTIRNLSSTGNNNTTTNAVAGISQTATSAGQVISQNTIHSITAQPSTATTIVNAVGLYWSPGSTGTGTIERNFIHSLNATGTGASNVYGIYNFDGSSTYRNNMIRLGVDASGNSITTGTLAFTGILSNTRTTLTNNYYFNSVYLGGSGVTAGTASTYAFRRIANETSDVRDNIFVNARSNAAGTGKHYGIFVAATTTLTSDFNDIFTSGTGGIFGGVGATDYATLAAWRTGTSKDASSISADPQFANATGNSANVNLHVLSTSPVSNVGTTIASVTDDFDGQARNNPPDIGADEINGDTFQFSSAGYLVNEAAGTVTITVTRAGDATAPASVNYATSDGTATAGNDYTTTTGTLAFAAGQTSNSFTVPIINDTLYEGATPETFNVTLSSPTSGTLGTPSTAIVSIVDNDTAPTISINNVTVSEGAGTATFTVTQSAATSVNTTFNYSTANMTAINGMDYTAVTNGTGTITAGSTSTTVTVTILDDATYELTETFNVVLSNPVNATIGAGTGTGTITDNEPAPTVGTYPDTSVQLGANTTIAPSTPPINATRISVSTTTNFKGKLEVDPSTAVVRVTDAHPAGTYTVTVTPYNVGIVGTPQSFTLTVTTPATCNPVFFAAATNFTIGTSPDAVAIGDFNGDGLQDIATANASSNNVSILIGNGAGSFAAATNFPVGTNPRSVAIGDFNGDGLQDIATANASSNNVSILIGNGAGSFAAATNFPVGAFPYSVAIGDFNGDGLQDIATANEISNNVSILIGNGAGSFAAATNFPVGASPYSVAIGDFNGDGLQDIATANASSNNVSILIGNGAGSFAAATNFPVGAFPYSVAIGDFNGDGKQDLAVANGNSNNVSILLGNGAGSFAAATNFPVGASPNAVAIGDFNGDGKQDLAVTNGNFPNVLILIGDGAGSFAAATNFPVGSSPDAVAIGDFNGDGLQDIATANLGGSLNNVSILLRGCPPPTINVTGGPLNFGNVIVGATSAEQTYTVSGSNLTDDITVTAPSADFQVSKTSGTGFASSITFTQTGGSVPASTVYVRFTPQSTGAKSGNITNASTGATTQNVAVTGTGIQPGTIQLSAATYTVAENGGSLNVTVTRTNGSDGAVSVNYHTTDGTATSPADYTATTGTLNWVTNDTNNKTINIPINDDSIFEGDETFNVILDPPTGGATLGTPSSAVVTITDNDTAPTISIGNATASEADGNIVFTVTQSAASSTNTTFSYSTADGTATAGADYTPATNATGTITAGNTSTTISIPVLQDMIYEGSETFTVTLSNSTGATIATGTGTGTITDDDAPPTTLVVNTNDDLNNGACLVSHCSLREAINAANSNADVSTITFNITGTGVHTISPASPLPDITSPAFIDGYTQPGSSPNSADTTDNAVIQIELDGTGAGASADGLRFASNDSGVRGLAINRFSRNGIMLVGSTGFGDNNNIRGNFIGTDALGTVDLGNGGNGISVEIAVFGQNVTRTQVGGLTRASRNIISGNNGAGIEFSFGADNIVQGNFIGLGADGATAIGNNQFGVSASSFSSNTVIGGDDLADGTADNNVDARNYISGNGNSGIGLGNATIKGNFIGTDTTGTLARPNASGGIGGNIANNSVIGGTTAGAGNLISGNTGNGITIGFSSTVTVQGNRIGTKVGGLTTLPNTANGIELAAGGSGNIIGGIGAGEANIIAFNGSNGVQITDVANAPVNNPVRGNSIFANDGLGINLGQDAVTPNDAGDGDNGANNLQNFPVITSAQVLGATNTINGTLNSTAGQTFTIDFYSNAACDASGNGEGKTYLGSVTTATTDSNGDVSFTFSPATLTGGETVTATATDSNGNTSEFSACAIVPVPQMGTLQFSAANYNDSETNTTHNATITVTRTGGSDGAVSVHYATSDGTATAGSDYTATSGDLMWADGDATDKTFTVSVTGDTTFESDETVNLTLSAPTGGATLGTPSTATLTIVNDDAVPSISINDVTFTGVNSIAGKTVVGPVSGFTVTLSNPSSQTITVNYATADNTAIAGEDYVATSGTLTFNPGETSKPIPVSIVADMRNEATETFFVNLDTPTNATIADAQGVGTIPNDDPQPSIAITDVLISEPATVGGTSTANFTVTLSAVSGQTVTVHYSTADGTATAPADYVGIPDTTLTFMPGETTKTVSVTINGDGVAEGNETFFVNLSMPTNATIADPQGQGTITDAVAAGQMLISEFRFRGAQGARDEYIELYNNTDSSITVATTDGSSGWRLTDSSGTQLVVNIPAGTTIPARSHRLYTNEGSGVLFVEGGSAEAGYSLGSYATGDQTYVGDIADNSGIALFRTSNNANLNAANVLDAVGFTTETNAVYREGAGLAPIGAVDGEYALTRKTVTATDAIQDTDNNASDFYLVSTTGCIGTLNGSTCMGTSTTLGAPGPENSTSPTVKHNAQFPAAYLEPMTGRNLPPNRVRTICLDPTRPENCDPNKSANGFLSIRRRFTNQTGQPVSRLRFRIVDFTTLGNDGGTPATTADLRALSSMDITVNTTTNPTGETVRGTTLEQPPAQSGLGGGINSTLAAGTITPSSTLANGDTINVQFLLGVMRGGNFRFLVIIEAAP